MCEDTVSQNNAHCTLKRSVFAPTIISLGMNCSHTTKFPVPVFLQIPTILEKGELKNLNQIMLSIETFTLMNI